MGNCPLSEYKDDGEFKYINKEYPGLIAVHKDPWIFVVPQFLNKEECNSLIQYSSPHLNTSVSFVDNKICKNNDRKSNDVRLNYSFTSSIQKKISSLIHYPVENFEPLKVIKYEEGDFFLPHHDGFRENEYKKIKDELCDIKHNNRVVNCLIYLNSCKSGGETLFTKYNIKIKPYQGLCVIHFPARLPTFDRVFPKNIQIGTKLLARTEPNENINKTYASVVEIISDELFRIDYDECFNKNFTQIVSIKDEGIIYTIVESLKGITDERLIHQGLPVKDEKYIACQWCFPGKYNRHSQYAHIPQI